MKHAQGNILLIEIFKNLGMKICQLKLVKYLVLGKDLKEFFLHKLEKNTISLLWYTFLFHKIPTGNEKCLTQLYYLSDRHPKSYIALE